jgi:hypothetical protein
MSIPGGTVYVAPPTFRYFKLGEDYPAKQALETVVNHIASIKCRRMAAVDYLDAKYELGQILLGDAEGMTAEEINARFPNYATWFTFDMGISDLPGTPPVETFQVQLLEAEDFTEPEIDAQTSVLNIALGVGYDGIGLMFRFIREPEAIYCECGVLGWQGDGQEMAALARHLETTS